MARAVVVHGIGREFKGLGLGGTRGTASCEASRMLLSARARDALDASSALSLSTRTADHVLILSLTQVRR